LKGIIIYVGTTDMGVVIFESESSRFFFSFSSKIRILGKLP